VALIADFGLKLTTSLGADIRGQANTRNPVGYPLICISVASVSKNSLGNIWNLPELRFH